MNAYPDLDISSANALAAGHLTDDQIDDQLIGDLAAAPAAHLAACSLCAERVATAASPLSDFQNVSTAWSERRSATLPIPVLSQPRPLWQRYTAWATASLTLAFGMAFLNANHQFSLRTAAPLPAPVAQPPPQASLPDRRCPDRRLPGHAPQPRAAVARSARHPALCRQPHAAGHRRFLRPLRRFARSPRPHARRRSRRPATRFRSGLT